MVTLTVFANFFINDEERFLRTKDSFLSFKDISAQKWVINVRGKYKLDVLFFLHDHLGEKLSAHVLESKKGWFHDSRSLIKEIDTDFVLFWIEDHLNMVDVKKYDEILDEMKQNKVDVLPYSWFSRRKLDIKYNGINSHIGKNIGFFLYDVTWHFIIEKNVEGGAYIIICVSIFSSSLFKKIINKNDPVFKRWSKKTPFDFEKGPKDTHWLPFVQGIPKYELFASIDDDVHAYKNEGLSLQSRGLYPKRVVRNKEMEMRKRPDKIVLKIYKAIIPLSMRVLIKRIKYTVF